MKTVEEAIAYMSESKDVPDWNERRKKVFELFDGETKELILAIDGVVADERSLIVKTLGKDNNDDGASEG